MKVQRQSGYNVGILYTTQKMIEDISSKSGPLAVNNEYQVHYNTVVFRLSNDTEFVDIAIPTVVFNYPQRVSSAHINFNLKDIKKVLEKADKLTEEMSKIVIAKFYNRIKEFADSLGLNISVSKEIMSNIHRHPGGMSSFSNTDYDTNPNNPGIVFPLADAKNTPIFSSIILHNPLTLAHTEYRVANKINDIMTYYEGSCFTFTKGYIIERPSLYKSFTGHGDKTVLSYTEPQAVPSLVKEIFNIFEIVDYEPSTHLILADNLKIKTHSGYKYDNNKQYKIVRNTTPKPHTGRLPLMLTLVNNESTYRTSVFTTDYGKYLGGDIIEAWEYATDPDNGVLEDKDYSASITINQFFDILSKYKLLALYISPYEEEGKDTKIKHYKQDSLSYSNDEDEFPIWSYTSRY